MELKKLWNVKVTVITIEIGALGTVIKESVPGLEDLEITRDYPNYRITEINQNTDKSSWRLEETCSHSNFSERPSANTDVKNCQGVNNGYSCCLLPDRT